MYLYELLILLSFLSFIGLLGFKLYHIFHKAEKIDYPIIFLSFIGIILSWGILFSVSILNYSNSTGLLITRLSGFMLPFSVLLLVIEIMLKKFGSMMFNKSGPRDRSMPSENTP